MLLRKSVTIPWRTNLNKILLYIKYIKMAKLSWSLVNSRQRLSTDEQQDKDLDDEQQRGEEKSVHQHVQRNHPALMIAGPSSEAARK